MTFIISQILGTIGYSLLAYSFFRKKRIEILLIQIFAYIGFTTHYALLGALTGTVCNILGFIALILIYFFSNDNKKKKILVMILLPLLAVMSYISYENIYSLFPKSVAFKKSGIIEIAFVDTRIKICNNLCCSCHSFRICSKKLYSYRYF